MKEKYDKSCRIVSTCGIAMSCDQPPIYDGNHYSRNTWDINSNYGDTVHVSHRELKSFSRIISSYKSPVSVVMNGDDHIMPDDHDGECLSLLLENENTLVVFSTNARRFHPKCVPIPIGVDYHTLRLCRDNRHDWGNPGTSSRDQDRELVATSASLKPLGECLPIAISNFHLAMDRPPRRKAMRLPIHEATKDCDFIRRTGKMQRISFWKSTNDFAFVMCPPGQGYDTHRAWEVLALGRIPIIQKLEINEVYGGLPVWEIEDWAEFGSLKTGDLERKLAFFVEKWKSFEFQKTTLSYWVGLLGSKKPPHSRVI